MENQAIITVETDFETKKSVEELYARIGLSLSDAVNLFFKKSLQEDGFPIWDYRVRYNKETVEAIEEAEEMLRNPHLYKSFNSVEELFADLDSDDDDDEI